MFRLLRVGSVLHGAEEVHDAGEDDEKDTTTGSESENLGDETLVKSAEALLPGDGEESGPGPVVLGDLTGDLDGVLDAGLDNVHGGVEDGTDGTTYGTGDQVVGELAGLVAGLGEKLPDLEDAAKVTGVPGNVPPKGGLETVVHGEETLVLDGLADNIHHSVVLAGGGLVLESDLDKLKRHDDEGFGGTGAGTSKDGEGLGHLVHGEEVAVDLSPLVVGGELGGTLGGLHQDGGGDTTVETRGTAGTETVDY